MLKVSDDHSVTEFLISDKYVEIFNEMFKTGVQVSASPPRRSTALRQQFAIANSTTDSGLLLFPKNLLLRKIFSGALIIPGVLGACFTHKSTTNSTSCLSIFLIDTIKKALSFLR